MKKRGDNYLHTESFNVVLDSRNGQSFNSSKNSIVNFTIQNGIRKPIQAIQMTFSVLSFTCPISWYIINSSNNTLNMIISSTLYNLNFSSGNHNIYSFISEFNSLLSGLDISIDINPLTNIFTITSKTYNFSIYNTSTIYNIMGFAKGTGYNAVNISGTNKYVLKLPYTCNFAGLNSFNVHCRNINTRTVDSLTGQTGDIICTCPLNNAQNNLLFYEKKTDYEFILSNDDIEFLQISILDDIGNFIDFNNQNWNMVMQFKILYSMESNSMKDSFYEITGYHN